MINFGFRLALSYTPALDIKSRGAVALGILDFWLFWWTFKLQREKTTMTYNVSFSPAKKKKQFKEETPWLSKSSHVFWTRSEFLLHENPHFHILGPTLNSENYSFFGGRIPPPLSASGTSLPSAPLSQLPYSECFLPKDPRHLQFPVSWRETTSLQNLFQKSPHLLASL